jgi:polysaccharide biosynthesis protein PslG
VRRRPAAPAALLACLLALVALGAAAGCAATGSDDRAPAASGAPAVGIAANTLGWGPDVGRAQNYVQRAGVTLMREELSWYLVEPTRGARRWAKTDRLMVAAAHRRLELVVLLTGTPAWAARPGHGLPTRTAAYGAYVRDVVARYGPNGSFWRRHPTLPRSSAPRWFELWNEPFFAPPVRSALDAQRYAALAQAGLKAGRAADRDARFLVAADTSYEAQPEIATDWLDRVDRAAPGLLAAADGVAAHPYSNLESISEGEVAHLRAALSARDLDQPIWVTEIGWSTCSDRRVGCTGESGQAAKLRAFLTAMNRRGRADVAAVIVYNLHDLGTIPAEREQHFGMLRLDQSRKPAWSVLRRFATSAHASMSTADSPGRAWP